MILRRSLATASPRQRHVKYSTEEQAVEELFLGNLPPALPRYEPASIQKLWPALWLGLMLTIAGTGVFVRAFEKNMPSDGSSARRARLTETADAPASTDRGSVVR